MTIQEFETKIQKDINPLLSVRKNFNTVDGVHGVYMDGVYLGVTLPPSEIRERSSEFYLDPYGYPYAGQEEALAKIRGKLSKMTQETRDFFND